MRAALWALMSVVLVACGPSSSANNDEPDAGDACFEGSTVCDGLDHQTCQNGELVTTETCSDWCDNSLGCTLCEPSSATCNGDVSTACLSDGSGYVDQTCDAVQDVSCNPGSGYCDGACAPDSLRQGNLGCDFYPTVTAQLVSNTFAYSVVVSNFGTEDAVLTIEGGALASPIVTTVTAGNLLVQDLPWVPTLKKCTGVAFGGCPTPDPFVPELVAGGAYRVRATRPVSVYQFSPLNYTNGLGEFSYTNDASLVLPVHSFGREYRVSAFPFWPAFSLPGMVSITASEDATTVMVSANAPVTGNGMDFQVGVPTAMTLQQGDVLQLLNMSGDLSGSLIESDKPVQVIAGHYCTNVPLSIPYCDHIEESMLPVESLSTSYALTAPALPALPSGKERVIRIIATEDNTSLSYDPALPGAPAAIANAGGMIAVEQVTGDYVVTADKKILVTQLMEGQDAGGGTGDPALTTSVPIDQYRTDYQFHAPINYEVNYVNVTAPAGTMVMLDGALVTGFVPIGAGTYAVARVQLDNGPGMDGSHSITADEAFGITVYGYGQYTSFWYPGGLDLTEIIVD